MATTRRGRPPLNRPMNDTGTPELVLKRLLGCTAEPLDLCLERDIITIDQHWCGIHLRWLYTLRYGAPSVRATDPLECHGMDIKTDDPQWRQAREEEYTIALATLGPVRSRAALGLAVFNERPLCLTPQSRALRCASQELDTLREALDELVHLWRRPKTN